MAMDLWGHTEQNDVDVYGTPSPIKAKSAKDKVVDALAQRLGGGAAPLIKDWSKDLPIGSGGGGNDGNPWGGYYFGGGGSYGSFKSPKEAQEETQAAINNLIANYGDRYNTMKDASKDSLDTIKSQWKENEDTYKFNLQKANMISPWQPNKQREQSAYQAIRERMANAAYGSGLKDLNKGMARNDDMADVELINSYKENVANFWDAFRSAATSIAANYADQVNSIKDEFSKLNSQLWSSGSNINPLLFTKENLEKAKNGESVTVGEGTDAYTLPSFNYDVPDDLRSLFVKLEVPNVFNPLVGNYVRPDNAVVRANKVGNTGQANKASIAHREFGNEMDAYKRRV